MPEPTTAGGGSQVVGLNEVDARDDRSMAWFEYLVSFTAVAAALLLAIGH